MTQLSYFDNKTGTDILHNAILMAFLELLLILLAAFYKLKTFHDEPESNPSIVLNKMDFISGKYSSKQQFIVQFSPILNI
jgi:hypothetical protein